MNQPVRVFAEELSRREFLRVSAAVGGGLLLSIALPSLGSRAEAAGTDASVTAWVRIAADDTVTIMVPTSEMGQGILSSLPQLLAEEMKADWSKVRSEHAPNDAAFGPRLTGGSSSVRTRYVTLRRAGAAVRDLLVRAAAQFWAIEPSACVADQGIVENMLTHERLSFGDIAPLVTSYGLEPASDTAYLDSLLTPDVQMKLIGQRLPRPDLPDKVNGSALFGIDVRLPGMVYAAVKHCPALGGSLATTPARPSGALAVVPLKNAKGVLNAVAVVARDTWSAMRLAKSLRVSWKIPSDASAINSSAIAATAQQLLTDGAPVIAENIVNDSASNDLTAVDVALMNAVRTFDLTYSLPYLAHMTFEPLNCTAQVTTTSCTLWVPTQSVSSCATTAQSLTGIPASQIVVHNMLLGGGLGRKFEQDFVSQAIQIAQTLGGTPVKLTWSREEDTGNDLYRPMALSRVNAGVDASGAILGWCNRNVSPGILYQRGLPPGAIDSQAVEGARKLPYTMHARRVEHVAHPVPVPVGFWRSVGSSINAFVVESAIDEIASALGRDPLAYRQMLLANNPRVLRVLNAAATRAGWGRALPAGRALGLAVAESFNTIVCEVVEISVPSSGGIRVHNVWAAVDCGKAINPDTVEQQIEGGMVYGLTAALWGKITWLNGGTVEKNFNKSRKLLMREMPVCETVILETAGVPLGGIGEPGTPPIAPAVANAYARLTGIRVRDLPMFPAASGTTDG
jgi:isoquinoline 1-oxidoreductase beta subunit